jgi:hypothetical protein
MAHAQALRLKQRFAQMTDSNLLNLSLGSESSDSNLLNLLVDSSDSNLLNLETLASAAPASPYQALPHLVPPVAQGSSKRWA